MDKRPCSLHGETCSGRTPEPNALITFRHKLIHTSCGARSVVGGAQLEMDCLEGCP
jgi:hypothetical protein